MNRTYDVLCLGMMVFDVLVQPIEKSIFDVDTTKVDEIRTASGGDAMTQAIISARLGCRTGLIGKIGTDFFGQQLLNHLTDNNVDNTLVKIDDQVDTSVSIALIDSKGNRNFVCSPGLNNKSLSIDDFDSTIFSCTKIVSYGSLFFMHNLDENAALKVFKVAQEKGAITVADCCQDVYQKGPQIIFDALPYIDYFVPSYTEAAYITRLTNTETIACQLHQNGCKNVIIKLGEKGCYLKSNEHACLIPAVPVKNVKDTTGAGDNFVGGLIAALAEGREILEAIHFAEAVASISIQQIGACSAVKSREQVLNYIEKQ